jgi:hypothetical protein
MSRTRSIGAVHLDALLLSFSSSRTTLWIVIGDHRTPNDSVRVSAGLTEADNLPLRDHDVHGAYDEDCST